MFKISIYIMSLSLSVHVLADSVSSPASKVNSLNSSRSVLANQNLNENARGKKEVYHKKIPPIQMFYKSKSLEVIGGARVVLKNRAILDAIVPSLPIEGGVVLQPEIVKKKKNEVVTGQVIELIADNIISFEVNFEDIVLNEALPMTNYRKQLDFKNLEFDFLSNVVENIYSDQLPVEAIGLHSGSGKLLKSKKLPETFLGSKEKTPYYFGTEAYKKYGTSVLISLIQAATDEVFMFYNDRGCIGNLSLKEGGQMPDLGQVSHQNGLDVDFFFYKTTFDKKDNCAFDAVHGTEYEVSNFDVEKNYFFLKELYKKSQLTNSDGKKYSYLMKILVHQDLKTKVCEYAKLIDPDTIDSEGSIAFETLRRLRPEKNHSDHFHVRLNCYSESCGDFIPHSQIGKTTGC